MINNVRSITLSLSNLKAAVDFYEKTLGLNNKYDYTSYVGFQCRSIEVRLRPSRKETEHIRDVLFIEFFVDNVDAIYKTLEKKGVNFVKEPHDEPWRGREASFLDPDESFLEVV